MKIFNEHKIYLILGFILCSFLFIHLIYNLPTSVDIFFSIFQLRLPRVIAVVSVAVVTSLSGLILQSYFKNDLAEPAVLGISSSASLGACVSIVVANQFLPEYLEYISISFFAIAFSILSMFFLLFWGLKNNSLSDLLLIGIALNSFNGSVLTIVTSLINHVQLKSLLFWSMGSFATINLSLSIILGINALIFIVVIYRWRKTFELLIFDSENMYYYGINTKVLNLFVLLSVSVSIGITVSICGITSFIGLIAPHIAKSLNTTSRKSLILSTPLIASCLLLFTDFLSKYLFYPVELPTSIFTAIFGVPIFLKIVNQKQQKFDS
ncbi:MAG: iron ABC transporter permease [Cytophagales bacterium]